MIRCDVLTNKTDSYVHAKLNYKFCF